MPISSDVKIRIGDSSFPKPFANGLEFNAPAHGTWNIVHIGFNIPDAHQIYICADNCLRGVVMTAAEMGELNRFSSVVLEEDDMIHSGRLEESTIEGVTYVLNSLETLPPVVILFPVCVHRFMGCDIKHIYKVLEERFPNTVFVRGFMDPVLQKRGTSPDQRLRKALMDIIPEGDKDPCKVSFIGCDMKLSSYNDLKDIFASKGYKVTDCANLSSLDEYYSVGSSDKLICCYPAGKMGAEVLSSRLGRVLYYLPMDFDPGRIEEDIRKLGIDIDEDFFTEGKNKAELALTELKNILADTPVAIDYTAVPRPLSLARALLEHGINVKTVYLDSIDPDEEEDYNELKKKAPELYLKPTMHIEERRQKTSSGKVLAIGQKAAWFEGTDYFVNIIEGAGLWGFSGITGLAELMKEAFLNPKDRRDIIPRKGLGCSSIYE